MGFTYLKLIIDRRCGITSRFYTTRANSMYSQHVCSYPSCFPRPERSIRIAIYSVVSSHGHAQYSIYCLGPLYGRLCLNFVPNLYGSVLIRITRTR
jgi:hypothetical protein